MPDLPGPTRAPDPVSSLRRAWTLERQGSEELAVLAYYRAIIDAQRQGQWLDAATTPAPLLESVRHAMRMVKAGRRRAFDRALAGVIGKHGAEVMRRVAECAALCAGERRGEPDDPRQKPSYLYFPGLPATPYFDRVLFPWIPALERQADAIRAELMQLLGQDVGGERVFATEAEERAGLKSSRGPAVWNGFYFYRHGERREASHRSCPATSAVLEALPLVRIPGQAPEVMFSVLTPGTHILPHRGVTNTRVVCHLPLIVPENCALVVGGERHEWRDGEIVVFDDTFLHEAWNRGSRTRVVLIFDVWNPYLTEAEREAVTALIGAIDEFNRAAAA